MLRRGLTPSQWRSLSRAERAEMLAYDGLIDERRQQLAADIRRQWNGEIAALAQIMIQLNGL